MTKPKFTIVLDDSAFSISEGPRLKIWTLLAKSLFDQEDRPAIHLISRSGALDNYADVIYRFPPWKPYWAQHDRDQVDLVLESLVSSVYVSSGYNFSTQSPNIGFEYDSFTKPEVTDTDDLGQIQRTVARELFDWTFRFFSDAIIDPASRHTKDTERSSLIRIGGDTSTFFPRLANEVAFVTQQKGILRESYAIALSNMTQPRITERLVSEWAGVDSAIQLVLVVVDSNLAATKWGQYPREQVLYVEANDFELAHLYSGALFSLQSSAEEQMGFALLEAQMCGTPCAYTSESLIERGFSSDLGVSIPALDKGSLGGLIDSQFWLEERNRPKSRVLIRASNNIWEESARAVIDKAEEIIGIQPRAFHYICDRTGISLNESFLKAEARAATIRHRSLRGK